MNKRCFIFIIIQLFSVLIEYLFLFSLLYLIFKISLLISIIITSTIFIIFLFITILAKNSLKKDTQEENINKPYEDILNNIINDANEKYHLSLKLIYVDMIQNSPAWSVGNNIYINNRYILNKEYMSGILAHEIGHEISKICKYSYLDTLKFTTVISKIFNLLFIITYNKNKILNILSYIFISLYFLFSINNLIFTYPFIRNDEYIANNNAVKLGYGESLRCYYGMAKIDDRTKIEKIADISHPSINLMLNKLNKELKIDEKLLPFYYVDNVLLSCNLNTYTITIPSFITYIKKNAFNNPNLRKIRGDKVTEIEDYAFNNVRNIEIIRMPNLHKINYRTLSVLTKLKELNIKDEELLNELIINLEPYNLPFIKNAKKTLLKNQNFNTINQFTNE